MSRWGRAARGQAGARRVVWTLRLTISRMLKEVQSSSRSRMRPECFEMDDELQRGVVYEE